MKAYDITELTAELKYRNTLLVVSLSVMDVATGSTAI